MADVAMIATIVAFVLLCVAYVGWCDRIIRHDGAGDETPTHSTPGADARTDAPAGDTVVTA